MLTENPPIVKYDCIKSLNRDRQFAQLMNNDRYDLMLLVDKELITLSQAMQLLAMDKLNWSAPEFSAKQLIALALHKSSELTPRKSIHLIAHFYLRIRRSDSKAVIVYNAPNSFPIQSKALLNWTSDVSQQLNTGTWKASSSARAYASEFIIKVKEAR